MIKVYCYLIVLFGIVFLPIKSFSQILGSLRIEGKPELLPGELVDKNIVDSNGERYAAVKILSNLQDITYDSNNGIIKSTRKPGEDILYVQWSEQIITVYKSGYKPLRIVLNEIGIKLNKGEVWKIEITDTSKVETIPIIIIVNQDNKEIILDKNPTRNGRII